MPVDGNSEHLASRIRQLVPLEISAPEAGSDLAVYTAYLERREGWRQQAIEWALSRLPASLVMDDGEVFFTRSSIRNALAHGKGRLKLLTMPYIAQMLKTAVMFHRETSAEFIFYNYAYPFYFEGESHYAIIVVREDFNGKRFYDNEFVTKLKTADGLDYSQGQPSARQMACAHPPLKNILRNILNVN
ncbi:MAG: hypothetical protein LBR23_06745 [Spirochaetaceae bacterium]|nr:hypothetical protein [Spirochaetaceae bacterium]